MIICIILSITGFFFLFLYDLFQIWKKTPLILISSIIGYGLIASTFFLLFFFYPVRLTPLWASVVCLVFAGLSFGLLLFSQFFEISYSKVVRDPANRKVFRKGTYGIVRHPGFWWFFFMTVFLIGAFREADVIIVCAILILLNIILVVIEDRLLFPRLFVDYDEYARTTPFLIPIGFKGTKNNEHSL